MLCSIIFNDLKIMKQTLTCSKIQQLCDSVRSLQIGVESNSVHVFGSQVYGLATKSTDVDLYLEIGKTIFNYCK